MAEDDVRPTHVGKRRFAQGVETPSASFAAWRTKTSGATAGRVGMSHLKRAVAAAAPTNSAKIKLGTSAGRIPLNVFVADRAKATAGFAKEVDAVNQYAAVM